MELGATHECFKCNANFGWVYTTPDVSPSLNLEDSTIAIASEKLINRQDEKYDITVKCPKCNSLNKFVIDAPYHNKK